MEKVRKLEEIENMRTVWNVYCHPVYQECLEKNRQTEVGRIFCRHDMQHFLDVARLAYTFSLERKYYVPKEVIYVAALLHDIGKWRQYTAKIPHEKASAEIAEEIMKDAGIMKAERECILQAILNHRGEKSDADMLSEILYDADKVSRCCFFCEAEPECDWSDEKKNLRITW